ncbi:MAG: 30S ribosome-binding factor RbfA [Anaerolineae bacterium]
MSTRRQRQVADLLQEEISELISRKLRDPRVEGVTVTEVRVSPDLRYADIYVTRLGDEAAIRDSLQGLEAASGYLKRELSGRLALRFMPELRFHHDVSWQRGERIDQLLDQIASEQPSKGQEA